MIRGRGHRPYRPPQLLTGHIDDFPLVPETPKDIARSPILQPAEATPPSAPATPTVSAPPVATPAVAVPTASTPPIAGELPPEATKHTISFLVQPDQSKKPARNEKNSAVDYKEMGVEKLRKVYDWIGRALSDRGVPPPEPRFPRTSQSRTGRAARSGATKTKSHPASTRDHHSRHCTICNHPERAAIEEEFIHWHDPSEIGFDYEVGRRAVYRHAHAAGLFARRERNMRFALGHMVQRAMNVTPTSDSILRAIRAYSCLNRRGQWTEPPAHVVVSSGSAAFARDRAPRSTASRAWEIDRGSNPALAAASEISFAEVQPPEKSRTRKRKLPVTACRVERDAND
jgi:hypothetical protein